MLDELVGQAIKGYELREVLGKGGLRGGSLRDVIRPSRMLQRDRASDTQKVVEFVRCHQPRDFRRLRCMI